MPTAGVRKVAVCAAALLSFGTPLVVQAADTFDAQSQLLRIPAISVAGTPYTNVSVTLNSYVLLGIDAGAPQADSFDPATSVLTLGAVVYQGATYNNVRATIGSYTLLSATPGSGPTNAQRAAAASATAQSKANNCTAVAPFYWEIGDKTAPLASGSVNSAVDPSVYTASTWMSIASSSKWLYAAYVAQKRGGALSSGDIKYLTFRSGYTNFSSCLPGQTIGSCTDYLLNGVHSNATDGQFFYNGGHMQNHANAVMGLGAMNNAAFATEIGSQIGSDIGLYYSEPQPAGGGVSTASDYARFLRKILNGNLAISGLLGSNAVCTNPATCPSGQALSTPVPASESWHYSIGHWVEDDPVVGDGAFSSPGAFGFYPWIDASRSYYGVVARRVDAGWYASAQCGRQIRKAWATGVQQ
jgi:hypothetical protein